MAATRSDPVRSAGLRGQCKDAVRVVEKALSAEGPVREMEEAGELDRRVATLRDTLIGLLRRDDVEKERRDLRDALEQVNAVVSLVSGVEFPSRGPERKLLKDAKGALRDLLDNPLFLED